MDAQVRKLTPCTTVTLTGTIPSELGLVTDLVTGGSSYDSCFLIHNLLNSSIPTQLGKLSQMRSFFGLYENSLSLAIPTQLGKLSQTSSTSLLD